MPDSPKKELSQEMRLLLAFILMGVVLFTTPYFYKMISPPPAKGTAAKQTSPGKTAPSDTKTPDAKAAAPPAPAPVSEAPPRGPVAAEKVELTTIDTGVARVRFNNRGATVISWKLLKFKDSAGKELELVNTGADQLADPFSLSFKNGAKPAVDLNAALFASKPAADGLGIDFEFAQGGLFARKSFRFQKGSYLAEVVTEVTDNGRPLPHRIEWRGGFGDMTVHAPAAAQRTVQFNPADRKLTKYDVSAAKDGVVTQAGAFAFAGLEDNYFTAAFLPRGNGSFELLTYADNVPTQISKTAEPYVGAAIGGEGLNRFQAFVGPKDTDIFKRVNPALNNLIDYGWFWFVAEPLYLGLHWLHDNWIPNYGWAIVVLTVIINFILFPLKISSMKSMKKMQMLQPQIQAINDKYKDVGLRDPKKQQQNQEIMDLYKKNGVNPAGGCVPLLIQIPFFIAFYNVLSVAIDLRGANWLWVADLSRPEDLAIRILPLAMIASQFYMQKMTPASGMDPAQQKMMLFMPLVFGFMFYGVASGLVLYWLTSNLVGIVQQLFFNKTAPVGDLRTAPAPVKKRK